MLRHPGGRGFETCPPQTTGLHVDTGVSHHYLHRSSAEGVRLRSRFMGVSAGDVTPEPGYRPQGIGGPWNVPSEAVSLVVKKFPRISSLSVHRLEGWASFSKKKTDEKEQFLSGLRPKVKFLSGQVNWTLRAHFWVFFSQTLPMASFYVYAHLSLGY